MSEGNSTEPVAQTLSGIPAERTIAADAVRPPTTPFPPPLSPEIPLRGTASILHRPTHCVAHPFRLDVTGRRIVKATFKIDGRKIRALAQPDAKGRWSLRIDPRRRSTRRHAVSVLVVFAPGTTTPGATLRTSFMRCG
jgi:hypothetical protein